MGPRDLPSSAIKLKKNRGGPEDLIIYVSFHRFKTAYLKTSNGLLSRGDVLPRFVLESVFMLSGHCWEINLSLTISWLFNIVFPIFQNCWSVAYIWHWQSSLFAWVSYRHWLYILHIVLTFCIDVANHDKCKFVCWAVILFDLSANGDIIICSYRIRLCWWFRISHELWHWGDGLCCWFGARRAPPSADNPHQPWLLLSHRPGSPVCYWKLSCIPSYMMGCCLWLIALTDRIRKLQISFTIPKEYHISAMFIICFGYLYVLYLNLYTPWFWIHMTTAKLYSSLIKHIRVMIPETYELEQIFFSHLCIVDGHQFPHIYIYVYPPPILSAHPKILFEIVCVFLITCRSVPDCICIELNYYTYSCYMLSPYHLAIV